MAQATKISKRKGFSYLTLTLEEDEIIELGGVVRLYFLKKPGGFRKILIEAPREVEVRRKKREE